MTRSWIAGTIAVTLFSTLPALAPAQQDEKSLEARVLEDWNGFHAYMLKTRKDLDTLQLQFNSSENEDAKKRLEGAFNDVRAGAHKQAKDLWAAIDRFIVAYPTNVAVRKRRLEDKDFDNVTPGIRAKDAETLYELTKQGEFLHEAAKNWERCYEYAVAFKLWKEAATKAETHQVMKSVGDAAMNCNEFTEAVAAYRRAVELTAGQKEKQEVERQLALATNYVAYWTAEQEKRKRDETADLPRVEMQTSRGTMVFELFEDDAPNTVNSFIELVEKGFYSGLAFHRNIAYFMIQGGDPEGNGRGGPGYRIKDEFALSTARYHFGSTLSLANTGQPNTNGSQFFVTSTTTHHLNGRHTVFGRLIDGHEVPRVQPKDPNNPNNEAAPFRIISAKVIRKRPHDYVGEKIQ